MPGKLILLHGLPGSGKSTLASQYLAEHSTEEVVMINGDDIRTALAGEEYHRKQPQPAVEKQVVAIQEKTLREALAQGKTVLDDNTNLNLKTIRRKVALAREAGASLEQQYLEVPVEVAQDRNHRRGQLGGRLVPPSVISAMAKKAYDEDGNLKEFIIGERDVYQVPRETEGARRLQIYSALLEEQHPPRNAATVLLDIDGTLSHNEELRASLREQGSKDLTAIFAGVKDSIVNEEVAALVRSMRAEGLTIMAVTARDDAFSEELISFLERAQVPISGVYAKRHGDARPGPEFKRAILRDLKTRGLAPVHAVDDDPRVLEVLRKEGLTVTQVAQGKQSGDGTWPPPPILSTAFAAGRCLRCGAPLKIGNIGPKCLTLS